MTDAHLLQGGVFGQKLGEVATELAEVCAGGEGNGHLVVLQGRVQIVVLPVANLIGVVLGQSTLAERARQECLHFGVVLLAEGH